MSNENCTETGPHFRSGHIGGIGYKDIKQCCIGIWGIYLNSPGHKYHRECRLIASQDPAILFSDNFTETIEDFVDKDGRVINRWTYRHRFLTLQEWKKVWDVSAVLENLFPGKVNREGGYLWVWLPNNITLGITPNPGLVQVKTYHRYNNQDQLIEILEKIRQEKIKEEKNA